MIFVMTGKGTNTAGREKLCLVQHGLKQSLEALFFDHSQEYVLCLWRQRLITQ